MTTHHSTTHTGTSHPSTSHPSTGHPTTSITSARAGSSVDTSARTRRYAVTMAFRTACFLLAVTVAHGWLQWVLLAGAVFLPYMGVLLANQANEKGVVRPDPGRLDAPRLTTGPEPEYVEGVVVEDEPFVPSR